MNEEVEGENEIVEVENKDERWSEPIMCGMLFKFGKKSKSKISWDYRYFILNKDGTLWYFANNKKNQKPKKNRPVIVKGMRFWRSFVKRNCLEIERADKPFLCYSKDSAEMKKWIHKFSVAGGIYLEKRNFSSFEPEYATKSVAEWKTEHILDWLDFFEVPNYAPREATLCDLYGFKFQAKKLTGKKLLLIEKDEDLLENIGIENGEHRSILFHCIGYLKKNGGNFDLDFHTVLKKMLKMIDGKRGRLIIPEQHQICDKLCLPDEMSKSYLWTGLDPTCENKSLEEVIESMSIIIIELDQQEGRLGSEAHSNCENPALFGDDESQPKQTQPTTFEKLGSYPIKAVLTEIPRTSQYGNTNRLLGPVISEFPLFSRDGFGTFMSGVIIGPWYFEWNDSSLCVPRRISNHWEQLSADCEDIGSINDVDTLTLVKSLSEFVCEWNRRKDFEGGVGGGNRTANCQDFVDALLGLEFVKKHATFKIESPPTAMSNFLDEMRKSGSCKMELRTTDKFRKAYKLENKKPDNILFESHRELDEFYRWLEETGETEFSLKEFQDEVRMLKTFDRAFWYRHFKYPDDLGFFEMSQDEKKCPFGDPRKK